MPENTNYHLLENCLEEEKEKNQIKNNETAIDIHLNYVEILEKHIEEQIKIMSEGLGIETGYILTPFEIKTLLTEFNSLAIKTINSPDLKNSMKIIRLIEKGTKILEEYMEYGEDKEELLFRTKGKTEEIKKFLYHEKGEGTKPYLISPNTEKSMQTPEKELTQEQKIMRKKAGLEGKITIALIKEDYEEASRIKKELDKLFKKMKTK